MKKLISVLLCICICFLVSGCGSPTTNGTISDEELQADSSNTQNEELQADSSNIQSEESSTTETSSTANSGSAAKSKSSAGTTAGNTSSKNTTATSSAPPLQTVRITFPEGTTLAKAFMMLDEKGVAKQDALFQTAKNYDFSSYSVVSEINPSSNRCFLLEGYLFPNTYEFYIGEKPESVIAKFLKVTDKKITQQYKNRAAELGFTMDEIITLASIIQKEGNSKSEFAKISSVFHNRLKQGMRLQADATIKYVEGAIKPFIDGDKNRYNSYYNTYKCKALPAGPICNPGIAAIEAALYPENTNYLYFVNDTAGNYYYAVTYEEHLANCKAAGVSPN